ERCYCQNLKEDAPGQRGQQEQDTGEQMVQQETGQPQSQQHTEDDPGREQPAEGSLAVADVLGGSMVMAVVVAMPRAEPGRESLESHRGQSGTAKQKSESVEIHWIVPLCDRAS